MTAMKELLEINEEEIKMNKKKIKVKKVSVDRFNQEFQEELPFT